MTVELGPTSRPGPEGAGTEMTQDLSETNSSFQIHVRKATIKERSWHMGWQKLKHWGGSG